MSEDRRLFRAEVILLIAVAVPLAMAEGVWWYWSATVLAVVVGWSTHRTGVRVPLSAGVARVTIVLAFAFLCFEYFWGPTIPILALSHFMMIVCCCRLMQHRTPREHAQILVLALLLLVIAAIVSDHVVFPVVLMVFVTVGIRALLRFHLLVESYHMQVRNAMVADERVPRAMSLGAHRPRSLWGITVTTSLCAMSVGIGLFVLFPRVGAGMLGHSDTLGAGHALTGFSPTLDFKSIRVIHESDRPVMRVRLTTDDGQPVQTDRTYYFRGTVLVQYGCRRPRLGTHWEWQEVPRQQARPRSFVDHTPSGIDDSIMLVPELSGSLHEGVLEQQYLIESTSETYLFSCYPAVELQVGNLPVVQEWEEGQVFKTRQNPGRTLRYTVRSAKDPGPEQSAALARHRRDRGIAKPAVLMPAPSLPREAEIRREIARITEGVGSLDRPANQYDFARRIVAHLQSGDFTYTLTLPPLDAGVEPVGEFLLDTREGHCEYFASAMAVMCQLSGLPARVVNGYRSSEYNDIGHFFLVRQKDAHAWVEVFIPGYDWVTFDPTPGGQHSLSSVKRWILAIRGLSDYVQFRWADLVVAYDSDHRHELLTGFAQWVKRPVQNEQTIAGAVVAFVRELFGWRLHLTTQERLIYWVFTLLVSTLVILISYVVIVLTRRITERFLRFYRLSRSSRRRLKGAGFYQQFCRQMMRLGFERPAHQTPLEFAEDLAIRFDILADGVEVVRAYYNVAFGGRTLSPSRRERIERFLQQLKHISPSAVLSITAGER